MSAMPKITEIGALFQDAGSQWMEDKASRLGAALAYYTAFSLAPLLVIVIAIAGLIFGREAATGSLSEQIESVVGEDGAKAVGTMVASANEPTSGPTNGGHSWPPSTPATCQPLPRLCTRSSPTSRS